MDFHIRMNADAFVQAQMERIQSIPTKRFSDDEEGDVKRVNLSE